MKKTMLRVSLAAFALAAAVQTSGAAPILVFPTEVYCMCACPGGGAVCLVDDSPDCGVCANAAQYCPSIES